MDKIARRAHAKALLNDQVLISARDELKAKITRELFAAKTQEGREEKYRQYKAIEALERLLIQWASAQ